MKTATMMKRTLSNGGPVLHNPATPKEHYVTIRKALNTDTKTVELHEVEEDVRLQDEEDDPPRSSHEEDGNPSKSSATKYFAIRSSNEDDENPRRSPAAKYFAVISAILTVILVRDTFRHVFFLVPQTSSPEDFLILDGAEQIYSSAADFDSGAVGQREAARHLLEFHFDASAIDGRRKAKHLLEIPLVERFLLEQNVRQVGNLHHVRDIYAPRTNWCQTYGRKVMALWFFDKFLSSLDYNCTG